MPEFLAQFLILLYGIFNPIVFLILLGALFIYLVYRVIKHFKDFYSISLRLKLPRALVDGVLGLLLILLLYDFYGQIVPKKVSIDWRSLALSSMIDNLIEQSIKSNGKDEIFGITAEEWNKPVCNRKMGEEEKKQCKYVNGIATESHYFFQNIKYDCKKFEKATLQECSTIHSGFYKEVGVIYRLINYVTDFFNGEDIIRNEIPISLRVEILKNSIVFNGILNILKRPCAYVDFNQAENQANIRYQIEALRCNKPDKDNIKLYLYSIDEAKYFKNDIQLIIKRED